MPPSYDSMQETEVDKAVNRVARNPWWKRLLIGALVGGLFGAFEIWFYEFSLNRLIAAILSGASFFAIVGLLAVKVAKDSSKVMAFGFAGSVAGIAYWLVARPSTSPFLAVGIGLVIGVIYAWIARAESKG